MELNEAEKTILTRIVDAPDEGVDLSQLSYDAALGVVERLASLGAVTLREGFARPTHAGIGVVALARARQRVSDAERALRACAVVYTDYLRDARREVDEERSESEDELYRAARAFVRAEQNALAAAKRSA